MSDRRFRNAGVLAILGLLLVVAGFALIWLPLGLVVVGLLMVGLAAAVARVQPTEGEP